MIWNWKMKELSCETVKVIKLDRKKRKFLTTTFFSFNQYLYQKYFLHELWWTKNICDHHLRLMIVMITNISTLSSYLSFRNFNWVFHDRRFCQIIWQIYTQGRAKKYRQKLPSVGIETRTSGSSGQCLTNWARQESVGQEISEVSFVCLMHHFTCWTLFISRAWSIEHDFIKAMKIQAGNWMLA